MSSLEAHVIPAAGHSREHSLQWRYRSVALTGSTEDKPTTEIIADGTSTSFSVTHEGGITAAPRHSTPGCWAGSCPSPAPCHTPEAFLIDPALGSGAGSSWQHLPLPLQLSHPELSRHVPVSPVWSDKVTQLTAACTKHLAFSSALLAVTLGTLCRFDWHHSNCFPSCPALQKRLKQGGRVGKEERGGKGKGPPKIQCAVQWRGCKLKQIWCQKDLFLGAFYSLGEFMSPSCCPRSQPAPSSSDASRVKFPLLKNEQLCPPF